MTTVIVRIHGQVHGVWYRGWTVQEATNRGLVGWVRNRLDGSVEALFHGPATVVEDMIAACHHGPPSACVKDIRFEIAALPLVEVDHFHQWPTL